MGGYGSGRQWYFGAKDTTNSMLSIDIRRWKRDGLLGPCHSFSWQWLTNGEEIASISVKTDTDKVILSYRHQRPGQDWDDKQYAVQLAWTDCHIGGRRPWFICPANGCGRRVAILYGGSIFACRHCHNLAYESQRETSVDRHIRQAEKIRQKLGWMPGILNVRGVKPKGMHWKTFEQLVASHDKHAHRAMLDIANMLSMDFNIIERYRDW